jgi:lysophospholipase L1-like esterase
MRCFQFLLIISLFLASCEKQMADPGLTGPPTDGTDPAQDPSAITYLALGDSYTIGESVTVQERWPVILARELGANGVNIGDPKIIATTGWTTANLLTALDDFKPSKSFDLVSLLIGVNNQYQGRSQEGYRREFGQLLSRSVALAGGFSSKVFVLSIPDWGVSNFASEADRGRIGKEIDQFNAIAKDECEKSKILFINITDISRIALNDPSMLASDGLHFSGKMHQLWVNAVVQLVKAKAQKDS